MSTWKRRSIVALWPSFLGAAVLEMVVFALISPSELMAVTDQAATSQLGVYTVAFFVFWLVVAGVSSLTVALSMSADEVNATAG